MFLRAKKRFKDGKEHRYWSIVENVRTTRGHHQRQVLYLGEINDPQRSSWQNALEVFDTNTQTHRQLLLFPALPSPPPALLDTIQIKLNEMQLHRPRQWGACWLMLELWNLLELDRFWEPKLPDSRKGTPWLDVLKTLICYRWLDPGSEWQLHRDWFKNNAMVDLLGAGDLIGSHQTLYRCLDKLLEHKTGLFSFLKERWITLFDATYDVLLYDLTSTYFESPPPENPQSKKKFGYSRDKRPDCVQVVIALIVTPAGFPLAYEVMPGNTSDKTTLPAFLKKIEKQYGKRNRLWVMDRGIPTEASLELLRNEKASYLVGTPRGQLTKLQKALLEKTWKEVNEQVVVKVLPHENETYVLTRSLGRRAKEQSIRRRKLRKLWDRLEEIRAMKNLSRDALLMKLGAAKKEAGKAYSLIDVKLPGKNEPATPETFGFKLKRKKLRQTRLRKGTYLLRSNLKTDKPEELWQRYILLTEIEQTFKELKSDLSIRPIYHQKECRIEAHIFVSFLSYCLQVTLKQRAKEHAPGLTPRAILEKFKTMQMLDVHFPTSCGKTLIMPRYTHPDKELQLLLQQLKLTLPKQPPPRIEAGMKS